MTENNCVAERARGDILGMPVISIQDGLVLGRIRQLLIDGKTYQVQGFLVEKRYGSKEDRILPFPAVASFGTDSITIERPSLLERKGASHQYIRALRRPLAIIGSRVFTTDGKTLGKVEEYRFSTESGTITALELSSGLFREHLLVSGAHIIAISPQTVMLKSEAAAEAAAMENALLANMDDATFSAITATLVSTSYAMAASLLMGLPMGFALGYCDFPGKKVLRLISDTLLAFPTVLIGLLVYAFITYRGPLGEWGLLFTLPGMAIGQTLLALPIVVSWVAQAVEGLDPRCRQTLLTLGARPLQLAWLSLCEVRFAIAMVCLTAFGRVITEVGIAMMLGGNVRYHTRTMTTAIALETSKGEFAQGIALGLVLLFMAFAINVLMTFIKHRGRI